MREILEFPNKLLRKKSKEVKKIDEVLLDEIKDLKEILEKSENGAGLAAPQIGVSKKFLGIKNKEGVKIYLNPRIELFFGEKVLPKIMEEGGGESDFLEGCLSFPDLFGTVKRYLKIKVAWEEIVDKRLETRRQILEGFEAIVWQHESDHLEGILFVDRVKEEKGKLYLWTEEKKVPMNIDEILSKEK
jgi:peptide deformylase